MASIQVDREALDRVIVFINGKGGVGKTTLCTNMGGILARSGQRVLVVDIDPQGNVGLDLGYADTDRDDSGRSLSAALQGLTDSVQIVKEVRENLDVIVGGSELHGAAAALAVPRRGFDMRDALARVLTPIAEEYDVIMVDCPPGNESLQSAAMGAARWVIAPCRPDEGTGRGLSELADRLSEVVQVNPSVEILGIALFAIAKAETRVEAEARKMVVDIVGNDELLFETAIRHSNSVAQQSRRFGKLAHELDEYAQSQPAWWQLRRGDADAEERVTRTASNVADDLHALAVEMLNRLNAREEMVA
ncbi:ParA family protein [Leucobacter musarum]|uniref:ParA family protein n=1 Tax=Leucobacter musarum TaxID=1930747 RepID=UPI000B005FAD|nr:AAA family ATPase [Leucobacter musarum]